MNSFVSIFNSEVGTFSKSDDFISSLCEVDFSSVLVVFSVISSFEVLYKLEVLCWFSTDVVVRAVVF